MGFALVNATFELAVITPVIHEYGEPLTILPLYIILAIPLPSEFITHNPPLPAIIIFVPSGDQHGLEYPYALTVSLVKIVPSEFKVYNSWPTALYLEVNAIFIPFGE